MNVTLTKLCLLGALIGGTAGCEQPTAAPVVAEGVLLSVEWKQEGGGTGGFTRINNKVGVPGGNGSWNVDAYGKLTDQYLIITRPQQKGLGPRIIPVARLVDVQFGDGGIQEVDENAPADTQIGNE